MIGVPHTLFGNAGLVYWNLTLPILYFNNLTLCMIISGDRLGLAAMNEISLYWSGRTKEWHYIEKPWVYPVCLSLGRWAPDSKEPLKLRLEARTCTKVVTTLATWGRRKAADLEEVALWENPSLRPRVRWRVDRDLGSLAVHWFLKKSPKKSAGITW